MSEICIIGLYAIALLLPLNLARLINDVLNGGKYELLGSVLINYAILFAMSVIFNGLYAYYFQKINNNYVVDVKNELFKKVIYAKADFLSNMNTGDVMSRIDNDSGHFIFITQRHIFHFINSIIMCIGIIYIVAINNITIALMLVIAAALPIVTTKIYGIYTQRAVKEKREKEGEYEGRLFEILKGMREIKLLCAKRFADNQILSPLKFLINKDNELRRIGFKADKITVAVNLATTLIIYAYSVNLILDYKMTLGMFFAVLEYVALLNRKMNWILRIYLDWTARKVSIDRVGEILNLEQEDDWACDEEGYGSGIGEIETLSFKDVSFSYGDPNILDKVSFDINKGESVGLVGISGAGKTTITNLILKLFSSDSGGIYINSKNIKNIKSSDIRKCIGIIGQDIFLFNKNIRYNLTLGDDKHTDEELLRVCKEMDLTDIDLDAPASSLSGGQKQRILIIRVLLKNKKFIIFDEATSALDIQTENIILELIKKRRKDITLLIISHRQNTIKSCGKIITINSGRVEVKYA